MKKLPWRRTSLHDNDDFHDDGNEDEDDDDGIDNDGEIKKEETTLEERGGKLPDNRTSLQPSRT